jgi:thioredoxin-related protein
MLKNSKYIIMTVIFLCLIILTFYNIQRVKSSESDSAETNAEQFYALISQRFVGLKYPELQIKNVIDNAKLITKIDEGLIILLSNSGCNPCQLRELKNLAKLSVISSKRLAIMPIYIKNYNRLEALRLRKLSSFSSSLYYCDNENNLEKIFLEDTFPKIFFIKNQIIVKSLIPIPNNEEFSNRFYKNVINELHY